MLHSSRDFTDVQFVQCAGHELASQFARFYRRLYIVCRARTCRVNHTNVHKIWRLCAAISSVVFNLSLTNLVSLLIARRSLQLCRRVKKIRGRVSQVRKSKRPTKTISLFLCLCLKKCHLFQGPRWSRKPSRKQAQNTFWGCFSPFFPRTLFRCLPPFSLVSTH